MVQCQILYIYTYIYEWQVYYKSNVQDLSDSRLIKFVIISMSVVRCIGVSKSNTHERTIQRIILSL